MDNPNNYFRFAVLTCLIFLFSMVVNAHNNTKNPHCLDDWPKYVWGKHRVYWARHCIEFHHMDVGFPGGKHVGGQPSRATALFSAAEFGTDEAVRYLFRMGANVNTKDTAGQTPLHMAAANGNTTTCQLLISFGADVQAMDNLQRTPLGFALMFGNLETATFL